VKTFAFLAASLATAFSSLADTSSLENFSPNLSTNTPIIWQVPTNHLPKNIWIYRRLGPRIFPETVISNAVVLASLQGKKIPKPSTNDFVILDEKPANYPGPIFSIFSIHPGSGSVNYTMPNPVRGSDKDIPSEEIIVARAWKYAFQLGLDPKQLVQKPLTSQSCDFDENGREATNHICGRGVYLSRLLDGIAFWGNGDDSPNEGFWIEFGSHGMIRCFSVTWPNLERYESQPTASPQRIIACIRAQKIIVVPDGEERYFERVKALANAKKFTITGITPYYGEGVFGELPTNDEPPKYFPPFAELAAVADFGNSNLTVRLLSPVLSSDATRLLTVKSR
jgi:hypothetical protein